MGACLSVSYQSELTERLHVLTLYRRRICGEWWSGFRRPSLDFDEAGRPLSTFGIFPRPCRAIAPGGREHERQTAFDAPIAVRPAHGQSYLPSGRPDQARRGNALGADRKSVV